MSSFHFTLLVGPLSYLICICYCPEADGDEIRLVHKHKFCYGRVEVYHNDQWGTVCGDDWDIKEADVVCGQLGCGGAVSAPHLALFRPGFGVVWMDNVHCDGAESNLTDCSHNGFGNVNCGHNDDAGVICSDTGVCMNEPFCGDNADCITTTGSYTCVCHKGYHVIISDCQDIDECADDPNICGPNANCINTPGSYTCTCCQGCILDSALNCQDVDECVQISCGANAECFNTPGSYYCTCLDGYISSSGLTWVNGVAVCESAQEYFASVILPEGQSSEMFFLSDLNKKLEAYPDIVLSEETVMRLLSMVLSVANTSNMEGNGSMAQVASIVLKISEELVSALVDPTKTQTDKSVKTPTMEVSTVTIGPEGTMTDICTLVAKGNMMTINLAAVAKNNNESASAVLMSLSGMEKLTSPSFFTSENVTEMFSEIIIATLPKTRHRDLPEPVNFTVYHKKKFQAGLVTCVFWEVRGGKTRWSVDGCTAASSNENFTVCRCTHLSTFAILLQMGKKEEDEDDPLLETVNLVCMSVGLSFLALTIFTFLVFSWNPKINNTARLHLSICLLLGHLLFLVGVSHTENVVVCAVIAGILHFLFLSSFVWMLLETLQLFLLVRSLSKVQVIHREGLRRLYLLLIGYGVPLVVVGVSAAVFSDGYGTKDVCWLSKDQNFQWSFIGPVCVILTLNLVSFCLIIWNLRPTLASMKNEVSQSKDTRLITFKIYAQFFMLACSWILGLFQNSVILRYIFIILNSQQGTFIFIVHCLLNKEVREEYRRWLSRLCRTERLSGSRHEENTSKDSVNAASQPTEDMNKANRHHEEINN